MQLASSLNVVRRGATRISTQEDWAEKLKVAACFRGLAHAAPRHWGSKGHLGRPDVREGE